MGALVQNLIQDITLETGTFLDMEHKLKEAFDTSMSEKSKSKTIIRQVFIPDLLRYIARFLGDR